MKKVFIIALACVSLFSFLSIPSVNAAAPTQYADRWEPAITHTYAGTYYMFELKHDYSADVVINTTSYAQSGAKSQVGFKVGTSSTPKTVISGIGDAKASIKYPPSMTSTWQYSAPN